MTSLRADPPIQLHEVSKVFRVRRNAKLGSRLIAPGQFAALSDVTFTVNRGESYAVLGSNGAGKTTLLRLLAKVISPSSGQLQVEGPTATLLSLRSAFDQRATGRESVWTLATLLGLAPRQIEESFEKMTDFAGIGGFIDEPIETYSPGMASRLSFAVALLVDAPVLVVDEVIGVGDPTFQNRARLLMEAKLAAGTCVVLASHNLNVLGRMCSHAIWLDGGRVKAMGEIDQILSQYRAATGPTGS